MVFENKDFIKELWGESKCEEICFGGKYEQMYQTTGGQCSSNLQVYRAA